MTGTLTSWTAVAVFLTAASMASVTRAQDVSLESAKFHGDETIQTPIGTIELVHSYFDDDASKRLFDEMDYQRASQAYIWGMPLVSMTTWRDKQGKAFGVTSDTDFVVLTSLKEKRGLLTANLTTPYILNFINLKSGALQIEYPAGQTAGGVLDFWQRGIFDMGLTGPDKGKGGTYIVVAPEDDPAKYKRDGVNVFQSATNNLFVGLRILDQDPTYFDRFTSEYKMGRVGGKLATCRFIKGKDIEWSATPPLGLDFWEKLASIINEEPVRMVDKAWMALLMPLGIEKGKPFHPDARQKTALLKGAAMGELMARNLQVNPRYTEPYWPGTSWYKSIDFGISQETPTRIELDERTTWFYEAVVTSEGVVNPRVGAGSIYMTTKRDSKGRMLRADKLYKLHIPAKVPVGHFWALTLYSEETRRAYDNGGTEARSANLDNRMKDLQYNSDGSIDLFVGPSAPKGYEKNHMKTVGTDGWFVYFRLFAPLQPFFDKTFKLADFERID